MRCSEPHNATSFLCCRHLTLLTLNLCSGRESQGCGWLDLGGLWFHLGRTLGSHESPESLASTLWVLARSPGEGPCALRCSEVSVTVIQAESVWASVLMSMFRRPRQERPSDLAGCVVKGRELELECALLTLKPVLLHPQLVPLPTESGWRVRVRRPVLQDRG